MKKPLVVLLLTLAIDASACSGFTPELRATAAQDALVECGRGLVVHDAKRTLRVFHA